MSRVTIHIDRQNTRDQYRLRVMRGRNEAIAIYFQTFNETVRVKKMLRKAINEIFRLEVEA